MSTLARERQVLRPSQLNALARDLLEGSFPQVWVEGEISNFSRPASGHAYFTLKDARAQVRCALFRSNAARLRFAPRDGMLVLARGRLTLYEARGDYQLVLEHLEEAGEGALRRAFEELKARLAAEGLFDTGRKRPLPAYARRLAVITSPRGAAVRDVLSVLGRRFPLLEVEVLPVPVQGDGAAAQILDMLQRAGRSGRYDLVLLTRGGGSLEDLWAFNDEALARAIVASLVPVVAAIGHEVDVSLADFAADLRAPTPTAAAELCAAPRSQRLAELAYLHERLTASVHEGLDLRAQRLDRLTQHLGRPSGRVQASHQRLVGLGHQLQRSVTRKTQAQSHRLGVLQQALPVALRRSLQRQQDRWQRSQAALGLLDPRLVLERGYAWLTDDQGRALTSASDFQAEQAVTATLADGAVGLRVSHPPSA